MIPDAQLVKSVFSMIAIDGLDGAASVKRGCDLGVQQRLEGGRGFSCQVVGVAVHHRTVDDSCADTARAKSTIEVNEPHIRQARRR